MSGQHTARAATVVLLVVAVLLVPSHAPAAVRAPGPVPDLVGVWPLTPAPTVLAGFDPPGQPWDAGHRGVDLAGSAGQSVRAALAGTVRFAGRIAGRGVVVVDHGDTRSTYEPVDATVAVGSPVATGQAIGTLAPGRRALPAPRLPPLGSSAGRDLPGPAEPRRWRFRAAAAAVERLRPPASVPPAPTPRRVGRPRRSRPGRSLGRHGPGGPR